MELKVAKKAIVPSITVLVDGLDPIQVYPSETISEKFILILLSQVQKHNPELVFHTEDGALTDYLSDMENLETVSVAQESAIEELRTKNEEQETRIEMLEKQLQEAKEANEDWAKKFKDAKKTAEDAKPS